MLGRLSAWALAQRFGPTTHLSLVAVLSAACWGCGTVMSRAALESLPPLTLLVIQLGASVLVLGLVTRLRGPVRYTRRDLRAGLPGLLEPGLAYVLGSIGLALTTASRASLISAIEPIFVLILAWLLLRERLTWRIGLLAGLAVLGVALVSVPDLPATGSGAFGGELLILLGTLTAATYVVLTRRLLSDREPLQLTLLQQFVGLLGVALVWLVAAALGHPAAAIPLIAPQVWLLAIGAGIVQFALAFWLYLVALRGLPATIAGLYLTLTPLFGVAGGYLWLGERLTAAQGIGAVCILGTVVMLAIRQPEA